MGNQLAEILSIGKVMTILALDLAAKTGYALSSYEGQVKVGLWHLTRGDIGGRRSPIPSLRLWHRLDRCFGLFDRIVFEETFARGDAKYRLDSLQHTVTLWCLLNRIRFVRTTPTGWKKQIFGKAFISKEEYHRAAMKQFPNAWDDNMAAALWLLEYVNQLDAMEG